MKYSHWQVRTPLCYSGHISDNSKINVWCGLLYYVWITPE